MTEFYEFASNHPLLTWCLAWAIFPICSVFRAPFKYAFLAYNRRRRSLNIIARGWPTAHLMDADGDIVHPTKEQK